MPPFFPLTSKKILPANNVKFNCHDRDTIQFAVARGADGVHELDEDFTSGNVGHLFSSLKQAKLLSDKAEKDMKLQLQITIYQRPAVWILF